MVQKYLVDGIRGIPGEISHILVDEKNLEHM